MKTAANRRNIFAYLLPCSQYLMGTIFVMKFFFTNEAVLVAHGVPK